MLGCCRSNIGCPVGALDVGRSCVGIRFLMDPPTVIIGRRHCLTWQGGRDQPVPRPSPDLKCRELLLDYCADVYSTRSLLRKELPPSDVPRATPGLLCRGPHHVFCAECLPDCCALNYSRSTLCWCDQLRADCCSRQAANTGRSSNGATSAWNPCLLGRCPSAIGSPTCATDLGS